MAGRDGASQTAPADLRASSQIPPPNGAHSSCAVRDGEPDRFAEGLAGDNEQILEEILRELGPPVRGLLARKYRGVLGEGDFEDVLAITLFRVWQHRERFEPNRASLKAWFYRIATNAARDVLRYGWYKARRLEVSYEAASLVSVAVSVSETAESSSPESNETEDDTNDDRWEDEELSELLREVLAELPEAQRRIVLADAASREGKVPSQDLSDELGIPAATIRVYRRRAIARLRKEMDRRGVGRESQNE